MRRFNLTLLGGCSVTLDDHLLVDFATDKVRALLVYLALEPHPHLRTKIAGLFWPDIAEQSALTNLRQTVRRLRQSLEHAERGASERLLFSTRQSLYIDSELLTIDVINFERLLTLCENHAHATLATCNDCLPLLEEAANLYHGELLAGFSLVDAPAFEEWLLLRREYFQEQALRLFHTLATAYDLRGEDEQTHHWAVRQLAVDPLRESAHRQLMRSLARRGQRIAALSQFEHCRRLLHSELGVEPSPETMALYEEIRASRFSDNITEQQGGKVTASVNERVTPSPSHAATQPAHNLPVEPHPLVGRQQELAELTARLQQPGLRLLTLVGAGGMGKTRLALALAQSILDSGFWSLDADEPPSTPKSNIPNPKFPDGVFFVPLASLANPASLAPTIATTLGLTLQGASPQQALLQILRYKRLLLILDNFEHLLEGAGLVADLLQAAPGVQIITTSRERLNLREEHLYPVPPLAFTPSGSSDAGLNTASTQLFVQSTRRVQPDFAVNPANAAAVLRICQLAQGMPLALELAAAHVGALPLAAIAAEIELNAEFLAVDWRDMPERQRSMSAVFAWSWQLLGDDERRVLRQVSVFRGGFTLEAAQRVAGADLSVLMRLVHKSLLQLHETASAGGRYTIHELLRQFAAARLDAAGERAAVEEQHSRFYLAYLADRGQRLARREPRQASEEIQAELDNVRQAWHWAAVHARVAELEQAIYAWWQFSSFAGLAADSAQSFDLAGSQVRRWLAQRTEEDPQYRLGQHLLSKLLGLYGSYLFMHSQWDRMVELAQEAIALGQASHGLAGEALGYFVLGRALQELERPREAKAMYEKAIATARRRQSHHASDEMLYEVEWMGHLWRKGMLLLLGDYQGGKESAEQALHICSSLGKLRAEITCLANLATINFQLGDYTAARRGYEQAIHLSHVLGGPMREAGTQLGLGEILRLQGEYMQAQALMEGALMSFQARSHFYNESWVLPPWCVCIASLATVRAPAPGAPGWSNS